MNSITLTTSRCPCLVFWFRAIVISATVAMTGSATYAQQIWEDEHGTLHYDNRSPHDNAQKPSPLRPLPQQAPPQPHLPQQSSSPFTTGLLWRVDPPSAQARRVGTSYIFGTIHSDDPRVLQLVPTVEPALQASTSFCLEMIPTPAAVTTLMQSFLYTNGQTLPAVLGDALFRQLVPIMRQYGIPEEMLKLFKPWAVLMGLNAPRGKTGMTLDFALHGVASRQGKTICGLETVEEQIGVFEQMPVADQVTLLRETVQGPQVLRQLGQRREELIVHYLAGNLAKLEDLTRKLPAHNPNERRVIEQFFLRLIDKRNEKMVARVLPRLQQESVFVAVGALHLPGKKGMLQLLTDRGYRVSVVH